MEYLFLVNIGPVQGFIASARRTRDLSFGSWLLSELAKAAAKKIVDENGVNGLENLIFPAPENMESLDSYSDLNVANKIIARIHQSPQGSEGLGEKVHQAILERLHDIQTEAYRSLGGSILGEEANKQIDDLVEYFWVALPFDENEYEKTRRKLEALIAVRKNTRDFHAVEWGSDQPKSSIDGNIESVIPENRYPRRKESEGVRREKVKFLYDKYRAGPAERLSGVDLLKRLGSSKEPAGFPSTSHIAAIPFLVRLELLSSSDRDKARALWEAYIEEAKRISGGKIESISSKYKSHSILDKTEGSLLFEDRLVDLLDFADDTNTPQFKQAKENLQEFFTFVDKSLGKARPNPYYAILHADGDRMGQVIDEQAKNGHDKHRRLSQALDKFARSVDPTVKKYQGALVYAGGDDVLAFVPLHTILQCAHELADGFGQKLEGFKDNRGKHPTLSVGIAVVHHLHPLSDTLNIARAAEKRAKEVDDKKNALAITVRKRSGGDYTVAGHWDELDTQLASLITYCREDSIPDGTAYELEDMLKRLCVSTDEPIYWLLQNAIQADTIRILQRKLGISQQKLVKEDDEKVKIFKNLLAMLSMHMPPKTIEKQDGGLPPSDQVEQLINELLVAQIFADAQKLAEPNLAKEQSNDNLDY